MTVFSTRQLVSAVKYLHALDITHRDLKCENVLLVSDRSLKLTDLDSVAAAGMNLERGCSVKHSAGAPPTLLLRFFRSVKLMRPLPTLTLIMF